MPLQTNDVGSLMKSITSKKQKIVSEKPKQYNRDAVREAVEKEMKKHGRY